MSILIQGMDMPKNCAECKMWSICECLNDFEDFESICYAVEDGDLVRDKNCPLIELPPHAVEDGDLVRDKNCPLIELPPHGDLVDLSDAVHPNDSMRRMTIDEQLRRTCEGWSANRKQYVIIEAEEK